MNEFYAADPESCDNSGELRFMLGRFGPYSGRYLADFPSSWQEGVLRYCQELGPAEAERLKTAIRRAREGASLLRNNALPWSSQLDWIGNYLEVLRQRPGTFSNAIVRRSRQVESLLTIDDLELSPTADELVDAIPDEYVRVSRTLLKISPELAFIDPYVSPCTSDRRDVLVAMLREVATGKCRQVMVWSKYSLVVSEKKHSLVEVRDAWRDILHEAAWPAGRQFKHVLIDDSASKVRMHGRYLISIKGGVRYDQGFQRFGRGRGNEVSPVGRSLHDVLFGIYFENSHDMQIVHTTEM